MFYQEFTGVEHCERRFLLAYERRRRIRCFWRNDDLDPEVLNDGS